MSRNLFHRACVLTVFLSALVWVSCSWDEENKDQEFTNTPRGNFMALWTMMDEHYCFFDLKKEKLGVDWNEVKQRYSLSISDEMSQRSLFEVLCKMIGELRDGHVNLSSSYDLGRNWSWKTDYPSNFSKDLQDKYLGDDYLICGSGYYYRILEDNIGYLVIESFQNTTTGGRMDAMFNKMAVCNGLIIDIRNNGGGNQDAGEFLASHFTERKLTWVYSRYKSGPGHNDFSRLYENVIRPASTDLRWLKPVVLLVNRGCFSTANDFAAIMKCMDDVTLLGDTTGGGGGLPMTSELPNGWVVRYSSAPTFDADTCHIEFGVAPDIRLDMDDADVSKGVDTYIEAARDLINAQLVNP